MQEVITAPNPVLLLDLSLRCTGYALINWPATFLPNGTWQNIFAPTWSGVPTWGEWKLERADLSIQERVGTVALLVKTLLDTYHPVFVASEMPRHMYQASGGRSVSNNQSTLMQQRVFGAISSLTWLAGVPFLEVDPAWSKQALTGKRGAKKDEVRERLALRLGLATTTGKQIRFPKGITQAVIDALAVAFYLHHQRDIYGPMAWLDKTLALQEKPPACDWCDRRGQIYPEVMQYVYTRHRKN